MTAFSRLISTVEIIGAEGNIGPGMTGDGCCIVANVAVKSVELGVGDSGGRTSFELCIFIIALPRVVNEAVSGIVSAKSSVRTVARDGERARPGTENNDFRDIIFTEGETDLAPPACVRKVVAGLEPSTVRRFARSWIAFEEEDLE